MMWCLQRNDIGRCAAVSWYSYPSSFGLAGVVIAIVAGSWLMLISLPGHGFAVPGLLANSAEMKSDSIQTLRRVAGGVYPDPDF